MKFKNILFGVFLTLFLFAGCSFMTSDIEDVKDEDLVGENVVVYGEVKSSVKIGDLSGFIVEDDTGSIAVASKDVPSEGEMVRVSGELRSSLLGYYIEE